MPITTEYALIENGVVTNVIVADAAFAASLAGTYVLTPFNLETGEGKVGIGYIYDGETFAPPA
jgi:hypothetical protein